MNFKNFFLLTWRKLVLILITFSIFFFFRNLVVGLGISREVVLFIAQVIIPIYLLICLIYSFPQLRKKKLNLKSEFRKKNWFLLTWKKFGLLLIFWVVFVVLHNLTYAFFLGVLNIEFEEPVFFILANLIIPIYFLICLIGSLVNLIIKNKNGKKSKKTEK